MAQRGFIPETNHSNTIGAANKRWAEAYIDTIYAPIIDNATLSGTPTAPTPSTGTNNTQVATTAFVNNTVSALQSEIDNLNTQLSTLLKS